MQDLLRLPSDVCASFLQEPAVPPAGGKQAYAPEPLALSAALLPVIAEAECDLGPVVHETAG